MLTRRQLLSTAIAGSAAFVAGRFRRPRPSPSSRCRRDVAADYLWRLQRRRQQRPRPADREDARLPAKARSPAAPSRPARRRSSPVRSAAAAWSSPPATETSGTVAASPVSLLAFLDLADPAPRGFRASPYLHRQPGRLHVRGDKIIALDRILDLRRDLLRDQLLQGFDANGDGAFDKAERRRRARHAAEPQEVPLLQLHLGRRQGLSAWSIPWTSPPAPRTRRSPSSSR